MWQISTFDSKRIGGGGANRARHPRILRRDSVVCVGRSVAVVVVVVVVVTAGTVAPVIVIVVITAGTVAPVIVIIVVTTGVMTAVVISRVVAAVITPVVAGGTISHRGGCR